LLQLNEPLVSILDYILFKEKTHLKRGAGFTQIPEKLLKHKKCENMDIPTMIKEMFLKMFDIIIEPFNFDKMTEKKELEKRRLIIEE
jgi:hypothetical protein